MEKKNNSNNIIIALLVVLVVAVVAVGGYFIIRDTNKSYNDMNAEHSAQKEAEKQNDDTTPSSNTTPAQDDSTPADSETSNELEAGITYTEIRGNDYYVEVQVNGQVTGKCDISVLPTDGGQGPQDDDDLEIRNKVSICDEDFSLKGMNKGEHKVTVVIHANDGRTKTLEKIVNI